MAKKTASIPALVLSIVMLFSVCFVLAEADHDCIGEDCSVCHQISLCVDTLEFFGLAAAIVDIAAAFLNVSEISLPVLKLKPVCSSSLVALKVKLSD